MDLNERELETLVLAAREAQARAHAPYSKYRVGAAILSESGRTFVGCNVENASYGATLCAEQVAVGSAVAAGDKRWRAVAVFADGAVPPLPCGICRQILSEFGMHLPVISQSSGGARYVATLSDLLPAAFSSEALPNNGT